LNAPHPPFVQTVHFNTRDVEPEHRFEAWRENIGVFFDLSSPDGGIPENDIQAQIDACNLGETVFGVTRSQSQLFERKAKRVARDDMDHILIQVFLNGGGLADGDQQIVAGDMLIIDMDQPHAMVNTDFENLTLVLPRELQSDLSELLAPLHGKRLSSENPMVRFMGEHMRALWNTVQDMETLQAGGALQGTLGLLEGWLSQDGRLPRENNRDVSTALGKAIRRYIEGRLSETLLPEELAAMFRISRSQIYRIFESDGGVTRYIWERRMLRSLRMLSQAEFQQVAIGAIAFECGFSSESHFSRSFKSRFGQSPSQLRTQVLGTRHLSESLVGTIKSDGARFPDWIRELARTPP